MSQEQVWKDVYEKRQNNEAQRRQLEQTEREGRILAIDGRYDHWDEVIPHVRANVKDLVDPQSSPDGFPHPLASYHVVAIGCPGDENDPAVLDAILNYLQRGGTVLTTDWCLGQFLAPAGGWLGPDKVAHIASSIDEDVPVQLVKADDPHLVGLGGLGSWHLDGGSHLCGVHDEQGVKVLIESPSLHQRYGSGVILFVTRVGKGKLVHFVSHAYAQTSDLQGAQAAAMILANVFDLAVATSSTSKDVPSDTSWFRLRIDDCAMTVRSSDPDDGRCLKRETAKWLFADIADADGNKFYKYVSRAAPLAEFAWDPSGGWQIRVPEGSKNTFVLDGERLCDTWTLLPMGSELALYSANNNALVPGIIFSVSAK